MGAGSCGSNWNNFSMHLLSLHNLIWYERDPALRAKVQQSLEGVFHPPTCEGSPSPLRRAD